MHMRLDIRGTSAALGMDGGFSAYASMMMVDHQENNPVANVFLDLITADFLEKRRQERATDPNEVQGFCGSKRVFVPDRNSTSSSRRKKKVAELESMEELMEKEAKRKSRIARNRWFLAYTLLHNPDVAQYRSHHIQRRKRQNISLSRGLSFSSLQEKSLSMSSAMSRPQHWESPDHHSRSSSPRQQRGRRSSLTMPLLRPPSPLDP